VKEEKLVMPKLEAVKEMKLQHHGGFGGFYELPITDLPIVTAPILTHSQRLETARLIAKKTPHHPDNVYVKGEAPIVAAVLGENTKWAHVEKTARAKPRMLSTINLKPILQKYEVHTNKYSQEHVKKPITEPIVQPYFQEYIQQAQPIVHPIVQRITQPIVHRELHPVLSATTLKAGALPVKFAEAKLDTFTNKPILGEALPALKIQKKHSSEAIQKKHSGEAKVMKPTKFFGGSNMLTGESTDEIVE